MPPASPRKSSTSSGRRASRRRYLGVELQGEPVRLPSLGGWEALLRTTLEGVTPGPVRFRVIRSSATRAVVEVDAGMASLARRGWNGATGPDASLRLRTYRTWGTLVGARGWIAADRPPLHGNGATSRRGRGA